MCLIFLLVYYFIQIVLFPISVPVVCQTGLGGPPVPPAMLSLPPPPPPPPPGLPPPPPPPPPPIITKSQLSVTDLIKKVCCIDLQGKNI